MAMETDLPPSFYQGTSSNAGVSNNLCDSIGMLRDGKGVALVVSRQKWLQQHMWPASMSPTRPTRPMKMKARLAVPLLSRFLNSWLLGVPNNP